MRAVPQHLKRRWIAALVLLSLLPALLFWTWCSPERGCLALLHFGEDFANSALPEVQALAPPTLTPRGYDGQFYAQIALDPTLRQSGLEQALDSPTYRARRIGLPALAALLGLGSPAWTLQLFSVLNLLFWLMLAALLLTRFPPDRLRHWLVYFALLWSAGVLWSMDRSLTDLPAATMGLLAVYMGQRGGRGLMALSALVRETSLLSFIAVSGWRPGAAPRAWLRSIGVVFLMALPLLLWSFWIYLRLGHSSSEQSLPLVTSAETKLFAWPVVGLWSKLSTTPGQFSGLADFASLRALELLAPMSLTTQSLYLLSRPEPRSALWLYGVGFAVLLWLFSPGMWTEQQTYTRVLLPLTLCFNLLLLERRPSGFAFWFVLGNIGLCGMALKIPYDALMKVFGTS